MFRRDGQTLSDGARHVVVRLILDAAGDQRHMHSTWGRSSRLLGVFAGIVIAGCSGDAVEGFRSAEGAGGAASSTGGTTATGGVTVTGWTASTAGGTTGSGGIGATGSGGATSNAGQNDTGGAASADSGTGRDSGTAVPDAATTRRHAATLTFPTSREDPGVAPWFKVYRPADLDAAVKITGGALPVVVWANGGCLRAAAAWEPLYERWAAGGFVVIALDTAPGGNAFAGTTVADHGALVDWVVAQATTAGSPYAGKLDTTRIAAAGNSCGGVTALGLAAGDPRVRSVFVLSGSSALAATDANVMRAISAPVGYVVGGFEDIAAGSAAADYDALPAGVPGMLVSRSSGDHVLVSTDATILAQEAEIALNWMDLCLYGTAEAFTRLTSATVCAGCATGVWTLKSKNLASLK